MTNQRLPDGPGQPGGRLWRHPELDVATVRPGNKLVRDIAPAERELQILCYADGPVGDRQHRSESLRGHLVAVVDSQWQLQLVNHPAAGGRPGEVLVMCRCSPNTGGPVGGHRLDLAKVQAKVDDLRRNGVPNRKSRLRKLDVRSVAVDGAA